MTRGTRGRRDAGDVVTKLTHLRHPRVTISRLRSTQGGTGPEAPGGRHFPRRSRGAGRTGRAAELRW